MEKPLKQQTIPDHHSFSSEFIQSSQHHSCLYLIQELEDWASHGLHFLWDARLEISERPLSSLMTAHCVNDTYILEELLK